MKTVFYPDAAAAASVHVATGISKNGLVLLIMADTTNTVALVNGYTSIIFTDS